MASITHMTALFQNVELLKSVGRVVSSVGTVLEVDGINAGVGEYFTVLGSSGDKTQAEAVGFKGQKIMLMPFKQPRGIRLNDPVIRASKQANVKVGKGVLGRLIDPFGEVLDTKEGYHTEARVSLYPEPQSVFNKKVISEALQTGIKAIDSFLTLGKGQRIGIFAGSGVGKTSIFNTIAKADIGDIKVICLIGERGREVVGLYEQLEQAGLMHNTVIVAATSEQPPLVRAHAIFTATAIAEYFAAEQQDVVLLVDSITRHALAQREIGLAVGEPPTLGGFTPSVFAQLPLLVERAGCFRQGGSITAIYTVLVEGGDMDEPIADHMRSILDGHIVLSRQLADRGQYPPIDILHSRSRVRDDILPPALLPKVQALYGVLADYDKKRDYIELGGYEEGKNKELDGIVGRYNKLMDWLTKEYGHYQGDIAMALNQILAQIK